MIITVEEAILLTSKSSSGKVKKNNQTYIHIKQNRKIKKRKQGKVCQGAGKATQSVKGSLFKHEDLADKRIYGAHWPA